MAGAGGSLRHGHRSHECNIGPNKCRFCGGDHRPTECPKNGNSLVNMIANRKYEVSDFAKQKAGRLGAHYREVWCTA